MVTLSTTPYEEVNTILADLLSGLRSVLGDELVGLYLYGSLATGGFDLRRSDIDFLAVTRFRLAPGCLAGLERMHAGITGSGKTFAQRLEGVYIPMDLLPRYDRETAVHPCLCCGGVFYPAAQQDSDWIIQRHVLREQGVVVAGPPILPLIEPLQTDDLRDAVRGLVHDWWAPMLNDSHRLQNREYQAYAVLTFCRVLHTLNTGEIGLKHAAASWALQALDLRWSGLITRALAWPDGPQPDEYEHTLALLRYVAEKCFADNAMNDRR